MTRALALVLLLPLLAACVEPLGVQQPVADRADAQGFAVRTVLPADAPRAVRAAGALDVTSPGAVLLLQGWAPSTSESLVVVTDPPGQLVHSVRLVRPDAAAAVGSPDPALGFRVSLRTDSTRACVLSEGPDGTVSVLAGSDAQWCPAP